MAETLGRLLTDLGERSTYDAASQCSRCGYCAQACPTYLATGEEAKSPRGRNQLLRLTLEGKLDDPAAALEAFSTCLLCGACQTACYAKVPVPELALEGRRLLRGPAPWAARAGISLLRRRPRLFAFLLRLAHLLKRLGLTRPARPLLRAAGLGALAAADEHAEAAPLRFSDEILRERPQAAAPAWLYFAPCGPRYLMPGVSAATWEALGRLLGPGRLLEAGCCGLVAHNYGELADARAMARALIAAAEAAGQAPVVADCSSCAAHLQAYPRLFLMPEDAPWRARAEAFSARVKDAAAVYGERARDIPASLEGEGPAAWHDSCRGLHGGSSGAALPRAAVRAGGGSCLELPGAGECCGGAGAFAFTHEELSDAVLRRKISAAASVQARVILASSTSCLVQLARGLKTYYPEARARHLSEFVAEALRRRHGP